MNIDFIVSQLTNSLKYFVCLHNRRYATYILLRIEWLKLHVSVSFCIFQIELHRSRNQDCEIAWQRCRHKWLDGIAINYAEQSGCQILIICAGWREMRKDCTFRWSKCKPKKRAKSKISYVFNMLVLTY